ncbi:Hsp20/alpha crystallin family protein [Liquorilactobacillus cacaonum]|uniref:Heat shock protein Hsp20 n=1 Tax=Liquorilactobacillus cacaonum DSM 21116 TaxID=1423729 RepID=A0A0R2CY96_9LACO|nr:Hsp20/alpha crystallin family protein [Liquorilactobacillus cacaonum]KRM92764.1 heat shock protein Hsp20 [Liquorilactobacillus cacaonum DSM 21116]
MANNLTNRFNDLMGDSDFFSDLGHSFFDNFKPFNQSLKTDIKETSKDYTVKIDVPGITKEDISLYYDNDTLSVEAKKDSFADESDKDGNIITSERSYGKFSRQYHLTNIDKTKISANYDNGVLKIILPKSDTKVLPTNQIKID